MIDLLGNMLLPYVSAKLDSCSIQNQQHGINGQFSQFIMTASNEDMSIG